MHAPHFVHTDSLRTLQLLHGDVKLECLKLVTALLSASDVTADVARIRLLEACHSHRNGWGSQLQKALATAAANTGVTTAAANDDATGTSDAADVAADVAAVSQVRCCNWCSCTSRITLCFGQQDIYRYF
jgi:hypothetical protein